MFANFSYDFFDCLKMGKKKGRGNRIEDDDEDIPSIITAEVLTEAEKETVAAPMKVNKKKDKKAAKNVEEVNEEEVDKALVKG